MYTNVHVDTTTPKMYQNNFYKESNLPTVGRTYGVWVCRVWWGAERRVFPDIARGASEINKALASQYHFRSLGKVYSNHSILIACVLDSTRVLIAAERYIIHGLAPPPAPGHSPYDDNSTTVFLRWCSAIRRLCKYFRCRTSSKNGKNVIINVP